jgi:hypothetical protein
VFAAAGCVVVVRGDLGRTWGNGYMDWIRSLLRGLDCSTGLDFAAVGCAHLSRAITAPVGASGGQK